ncbi:unnamed protein product [Symbiodinium natans]|uniref:Uncharacterized protein n=1 Tax=Symbiodinium natans TaxID=878477 RepID=A0A812UXE2_9DINO|nr:unnamed protein product [Symbiodinium natans]
MRSYVEGEVTSKIVSRDANKAAQKAVCPDHFWLCCFHASGHGTPVPRILANYGEARDHGVRSELPAGGLRCRRLSEPHSHSRPFPREVLQQERFISISRP